MLKMSFLIIAILFINCINVGNSSNEVTFDVKVPNCVWASSNASRASIHGILYGRDDNQRVTTITFTLSGIYNAGQSVQFSEYENRDSLTAIDGMQILSGMCQWPFQVESISVTIGNEASIKHRFWLWQWFGGMELYEYGVPMERVVTASIFLPALPDNKENDHMFVLSIKMGPDLDNDATFRNLQLYCNIMGNKGITDPYQLSVWNRKFDLNQNYTFTWFGPDVGKVEKVQIYVAPYTKYTAVVDWMRWTIIQLSVYSVKNGFAGFYQNTDARSIGSPRYNYRLIGFGRGDRLTDTEKFAILTEYKAEIGALTNSVFADESTVNETGLIFNPAEFTENRKCPKPTEQLSKEFYSKSVFLCAACQSLISIAETAFHTAGSVAKDQLHEACDLTIVFAAVCKSVVDESYNQILIAIESGLTPYQICSSTLSICAVKSLVEDQSMCFNNYMSALGHDLRELSTLHNSFTRNYVGLMAPVSRKSIVDVVLPADAIMTEQFTLEYITQLFENKENGLRFMAKYKLIANERGTCPGVCEGKEASLIAVQGSIDGFIWRCPKCQTKLSVRHGSFFTQAKLTFLQIMKLIWYWAVEPSKPMREVADACGIGQLRTIVDWYNFFRDVTQRWCVANVNDVKLGGRTGTVPKIVVFDQSFYFQTKYEPNIERQHKYAFVLVEVGSNKMKMEVHDTLNVDDIVLFLTNSINAGTHVKSSKDVWQRYGGKNVVQNKVTIQLQTQWQDRYQQHTFKIKNNDEEAVPHTDQVWEDLFNLLKHLHGSSRNLYPTYLYSFMFRKRFNNQQIMNHLLESIRIHFPLEFYDITLPALQAPKRRTKIVDLVLPAADLDHLKDVNLVTLAEDLGSSAPDPASKADQCLQWCARWGLIKNEVECENCPGNQMSLQKAKSKTEQFMWVCNACDGKVSVRQGSIFENSKLLITTILKMLYAWCTHPTSTIQEVIMETGVAEAATVVDWYNKFRDICQRWCQDNLMQGEMLGGPGTIVEIDESVFYKTKYHRGRQREHDWVFGMVERGTNKVIMVPVARRDAATLLPIIIEHIAPQTWVMSDGWAAYGGINNLQTMLNGMLAQKYEHGSVNHRVSFINPNDPRIHTQSIEATWKAVKHSFKHLQGTSRQLFPTYLYQYMFRRAHNRQNIFANMLFWIRHYRDI